ncbi:hypothetical protein GCM10008171_07810 [Methylopila jiangsuensis]|uniref:Uncharacterized protein n=1 Tax=Methylopila jiangsuensis TaxID=586230 RepID=A0A9W6JE08_9HYPH|nr:hypothetical protein GCM10008171_07810 [Methylopila jiangsuensis]
MAALEAVAHRAALGQRRPAAFGVERVDQLAAAGDEFAQDPVALDQRLQPASVELERGEVGDQPGVDPVGLGLHAAPGPERRHLVRMDARERNPGLHQRPAQGPLVAAGGLERREPDRTLGLQESGDRVRLVRKPRHRRRAVAADVDPVLRHVEPKDELVGHDRLRHDDGLVRHAGLHSGESPHFRARDRDRDAGGLKMPTVDKTHPRLEVPPASPIPTPGTDNANMQSTTSDALRFQACRENRGCPAFAGHDGEAWVSISGGDKKAPNLWSEPFRVRGALFRPQPETRSISAPQRESLSSSRSKPRSRW